MIKIIDGDLLNSKTDIIAHQVNCRGAFNSGVARAIREHDIQVYKDYTNCCNKYKPEELLGNIRFFKSNVDGRIYANLFAQNKYGYRGKQYTSIKALEKCIKSLKEYAYTNNMSIAMPYKIGCIRGGADWNEVYKMIEAIFQDYSVELWRLDLG